MRIIQRHIDQSVYDTLISQNTSPILARIIAGRPVPNHTQSTMAITDPKLADLDHPLQMKEMNKAVQRIVKAIQNKENIGVETDHDCDGQTAHAVIVTSFIDIFDVPAEQLHSFIGHRLEEGYGLSEPLIQRILHTSPRPSLLITADNGSADEPRIEKLKAAGIDIIITDHHALPVDGPPKSAFACLNPTREDNTFPDPYIAGCMVAWLLMAGVRKQLLVLELLRSDAPKMTSVLDYVAVGTVADCVSMARSINNRAVVKYGLNVINRSQRPCWQAVRRLLREGVVKSDDLGFVIGPLLNSDGRLSDAFGSVDFLLSDSLEEAIPWVEHLREQNQERKAIQKDITHQAMQQAAGQVAADKTSLVIYLPDGHAGVHGISASRVKDTYGRPTIIFSPKLQEPDLITGSARSIDSVNIRDAIQWVADQYPGLVKKFGGHKGAAGLSIEKIDLDKFSNAFEQAIQQQVSSQEVGPYLMTDGALELSQFNLDTVDELRKLEPYGREFETPQFLGEFQIVETRLVGQDGTHAQVVLKLADGRSVKSIWFNACQTGEALSIQPGQMAKIIYCIEDNVFRGKRSLQLQLKYVLPHE